MLTLDNRSRSHAPALPFAAVNRPGSAGYAGDLQRHHLLPRQAVEWPTFQPMFEALGRDSVGFDDFWRNGMLLPCRETAATRLDLPLHLGSHRCYNRLVIERLGTIEVMWAKQATCHPEQARAVALLRIALLQRALRKRLLDRRRPLHLNRRSREIAGRNYAMLDLLADDLWAASEV